MSTPNLPLRYELTNDGTGAASTMDHLCSTVISEGGSQALGFTHWASTAGVHVDCNVENALYAIVGIRLKAAGLAATIRILSTVIAEHQGNNTYEWALLINPTVAGTFTYASTDADLAIEQATGATANTITGGHVLFGGYAASEQKGGAETEAIDSALLLGSAIDGTPDELVLCVRPVGGSINLDIEGGLNIQQIS